MRPKGGVRGDFEKKAMLKVGINGFGRIGRLAARIILSKYKDKLDLVAINTSGSMEAKSWVHLFKYDTVYGKYKGNVLVEGESLVVDGKNIPILAQRDPILIPWGDYGVEIVIESTGVFRQKQDVERHLRDSVKKVVLSAPPKGEGGVQIIVIGVNDDKRGDQKLISSASCTTNCVASVTKVMLQNFGIKKAMLTTIHAYTSNQELQDGSHKDLRRGRAAAANIVPTTTGATKATVKTLPELAGKFDGIAVRVPVLVGSLSDLTYVVEKQTTVGQVNEVFRKAASDPNYKGVLQVTEEPLVSSDIIGSEASAIVDLGLIRVVDGDLVKIVAWYDNEWGYANRLVEEVLATTS